MPTHLWRSPFLQPQWFRLLFVLTLFISTAKPDDPQPSAAGQAQPSTLKNLTLEQLSEIEVTSPSKEPTPAFKSPVAIYVITGEDIRRSGVTTIPDALRLAPGVEVARIDGSKWSVGIRGFGTRLSRDVLVLIDGRTVYTPLFAGTYWEVQDTLLEDIDRIEVIRGPGGTVWGPNAVNGVINIITKNTKDTQGAFASGGGGNLEQGFANFRYGGDDGNGLTYRVYAKGFTRGPEHHADHDNFDDWRGVQGGFRIDWSAGTEDTFTVQGDAYKQEDGERVSVATYTPPFTGTADGNAQLSGANVLFRWTRTLGNGSDFQLQAFYDRTNRYEPNLGENRDTFDVDFQARTKLSDRQELLWGAGGRSSDGHFIEVASGLVFSPFNRNDYLLSGFLEDDITLVNNKLLLMAGSKVLNTNYTGADFQPSVRLLWTPTDRQSYWAAYTHALRTPSDGEEDFYLSSLIGTAPNGLPYFARFSANPNFATEKLNGYEAGYRQLIGKTVYIDVAGFYNHYHDLFSEDVIGAPFVESTLPFPVPVPPPVHLLLPAQFRNDILGYTKGFEIAPEWRPANFWRLRGSYSLLHMNLEQNAHGALGLGTASVTGSSPRHEVSIDSSFDITSKLQLDLIYRYVSALPAESAPAYSTGDARIAWRFTRQLEFSVTGQNLFQPYHIEYGADPGGPVAIVRNVYASLAWRTK
ncbi:MAG TPA: TonB-dependent receptor [Bryobacteraceae bacterium]|nr:TonB-dependent receptor [Bryobacteraceae bacterium]